MRGEGTCKEAPEHNAEGTSHCIHLRTKHRDFVCCWCGDLFIGEDDEHENADHGQYKPRRANATKATVTTSTADEP